MFKEQSIQKCQYYQQVRSAWILSVLNADIKIKIQFFGKVVITFYFVFYE